MNDLVKVEKLKVIATSKEGIKRPIVRDVSFSIPRGEVLALIGESGSGKTTIALAMMGYARHGCSIENGRVQVGSSEVTSLTSTELRDLRGSRVSYVAQSAASSFDPAMRIMDQIVEATQIHHSMARDEAEKKAVTLFGELALPDPETIGRRYPHQVSGGQLQRLMAAMALITDPELIIFDEPTTALDVTTQIEVLNAFKRVIADRGITAVYVSHDLAVVAQMADQIVVLNQGEIREAGRTERILGSPTEPYTKQLLAAARPVLRHIDTETDVEEPVLRVHGLSAGYGKIQHDGSPEVTILNDLNFEIRRGSTLGVIGESGSGKSTLARAIAGLVKPSAGFVELAGEVLNNDIDKRSHDQFRSIQIVFQNADTALNPAHTVERILSRPLTFYHGMKGQALANRVHELLNLVQLPVSLARQPCSRLSGGQKQRINLARALAAKPDLILCDEITSALDTVVAAAILDLLTELRRELQVSYMFISHDISTVRAICDDILVLYAGLAVECGSQQHFLEPPFHPYTDLLIRSVPELKPGWLENSSLSRAVYSGKRSASNICPFIDRCPMRIDDLCNVASPPWKRLSSGKQILCHQHEAELKKYALT